MCGRYGLVDLPDASEKARTTNDRVGPLASSLHCFRGRPCEVSSFMSHSCDARARHFFSQVTKTCATPTTSISIWFASKHRTMLRLLILILNDLLSVTIMSPACVQFNSSLVFSTLNDVFEKRFYLCVIGWRCGRAHIGKTEPFVPMQL